MKRMIVVFTLLLEGCQSTPQRVWLRQDGQQASGSPVLLTKFNSDKAACVKDVDFVSEAAEKCMKELGYIFVASSEAPRLAAQFAANPRPQATATACQRFPNLC